MPVPAIKDGDARFARGQDSFSDPKTIQSEGYVFSVNMLNRGGIPKTRPGFREVLTLPDGNFQALTFHYPRLGLPQLLAVVGGNICVSNAPTFGSYRQVSGAKMDPDAKKVFTCGATKSVQRNPDNSLSIINPKSITMLQDGVSPATYYDGRIATALTGANVTPQGTHMVWTGGRLWTARREQLFAGDYADPLGSYETTYNTLGGVNFFLLPSEITGLTQTTGLDKPQLLAFTAGTTTMFQSDTRNRDLWPQMADFQRILLPSIGCLSERSIVSRAGLLWWMCEEGLIRLDGAFFSQRSSKIVPMDLEMIRSKTELSSDLSGVAAASYDSLLLMSVPHASNKNKHTWVLNDSPSDLMIAQLPAAWAGVWTGINPVQWAELKQPGQKTRLFCASQDDDGKNRVYEAFTTDQKDNGCDIPWSFETRGYTGGNLSDKYLRYIQYLLSDISGQVDVRVSWAGINRGRWKEGAVRTYKAQEGNVDATRTYLSSDSLYGLKKQSRVDRTLDVKDSPEDPLSSVSVEGDVSVVGDNKESRDTAFQLLIEGSGPCAIRSLELFMDAAQDPDSGQPAVTEGEDHFVRFDGAASKDKAALDADLPVFTSTQKSQAKYGNYAVTASATITSTVSQSDADKRAKQVAQARAEFALAAQVPKYQGGSLA